MKPLFKVIVLTLFVLLVVFAALADHPIVSTMTGGVPLGPYLRLGGLLGLIIAVFLAWGRKRRIEASQKFVRAQEVLDQAGRKAEKLKKESERLEKELRAEYDRKKADLDERITRMKQAYEDEIRALKERNIELKESVGKLMGMVKKNKRS